MINGLVDKSISFITKYQECDEQRLIILKFGLASFYKTITKLLVAFIICLILGVAKEFCLLLFFYAFIKKYSFGLHANTTLACWIVTLLVYTVGPLLITKLDIDYLILIYLWLFCFISYVLWSPADTPKRPLIHKEQRTKQKIKTCLISIVYLIIILVRKEGIIVNSCILALIIQAININPLLYKLTKTPFNNYKNYNHRKE